MWLDALILIFSRVRELRVWSRGCVYKQSPGTGRPSCSPLEVTLQKFS